MKVLVTLTGAELRQAAHGGVERNIDAMKRGRKSYQTDRPDHEQNWWQSHIIGAIGEFAVAKALGLAWNPTIGQVDQKDVGEFEVRTSELPNPVLRFRAHNDPASHYILAGLKQNKVLLHGWLPGYSVRDLGHMEFDNCWVAQPDSLYSMADLNAAIEWSDTVVPYGATRVC